MAKINQTETIRGKIVEGIPIKGQISSGTSIKGTIINYVPDATTTQKGIIRIATDIEAIAGVSENTAITPHTLKNATGTFVHEQAIASQVWTIQHDLNKQPSIIVVDSTDKVQIPNEIIYNNENVVTVEFLGSFAGKAYLN